MQGEFPARLAVFFGRFVGGLHDVIGQAGELGFVRHELGKGVGCVEQVLRELGG